MTPVSTSGKNAYYKVSNEIAAVPAAVLQTGTLTSSGDGTIILGAGTDFSTVNVGDWIFDATYGEIRQIKANYSERTERLDIDSAFTNAMSGASFYLVPANTVISRSIINDVDGGGNGKLNGVTFESGRISTLKDLNGKLQPAVIDATGTSFTIELEYV